MSRLDRQVELTGADLLPEPAPESDSPERPPEQSVLDAALYALGVAAGQSFQVVHTAGGAEQ